MGGGKSGDQGYEKQPIEGGLGNAVPIPKPAPDPVRLNDRVLGLDVAKYQSKLDFLEWTQLYKMGYRFVFAKCTDGWAGKDAYYQLHRKLSKQAGFLFGPYHFLRFGYDPVTQAKHFHKNAGHLVGELPPVLDIEWDRYTLDKKYGEGKRMDNWADEHAIATVKAIKECFGMDPIIYTNAYFFPEKSKYPIFWKQFKCWIPSYSDSFKPSGDKVKVPSPWDRWDIWQTSDDLKIGDVTAIDTNLFRGSLDELKALVKK